MTSTSTAADCQFCERLLQRNQELEEDKARLLEDRDALAVHVERLNSKLADINNSLYGQNLHVTGWHLNGDTEPMDTWFEESDWEPEPCDATSLARLKAEWQAEALEEGARAFRDAPLKGECRRWHHVAAGTLEREAAKLRRQAGGGEI